MNKFRTALLAAAAILAVFPAAALASEDVPQTDPSYAAVSDLAAKGLIKGYPKDKDLFQGRTVTRYEMAALVGRAVAKLIDDQNAGATESPTTFDEVGKMLAEFKVELAVMDTDISDLKLGQQALTDTILDQQNQINKINKSKLDTGIAKAKLSMLLQLWGADGTDINNTGKNPGAIASTFRIRRAEIRYQGNINPKTYFNVMFDPSKNLSLIATSTKTTVVTPPTTVGGPTGTAVVTTTAYAVNNNGVPLQDFVMGYQLTPQFAAELGQQKIPMSIEGYRSSSNLLTVERSLMNTAPFNQGRVGDIRDLGATFRYVQPNAGSVTLAALNDAGALQNYTADDNNVKEVIYNGQILAVQNLMFGGWGELRGHSGNIGTAAATLPRQRTGADFDYLKNAVEVTGEYEEGYDGDNNSVTTRQNSKSAYAIGAYKFSKWVQGVVREDWFAIDQHPVGGSYSANQEHDLTAGVNYYLLGNNSKIQFNWIRKTISGPFTASGSSPFGPTLVPALGVSRDQYFVAFQQQF